MNNKRIAQIAMTTSLYTALLLAVNIIPVLNKLAFPSLILAVYAFNSKDIAGSIFIGFMGTIIVRAFLGWPFSFHWSLANGLQPAAIAFVARKFKIKHDWLSLLIGCLIGMLAYPSASTIDYLVYQSKEWAVGIGLFYGMLSLVFSMFAIILIRPTKKFFNNKSET